jgi:Flp pilus assembly pilin Flp
LKKLRQEVKPMSENMKSEEFRISGEEVVAKIKELLHEGNVRRIILKDEKGVTLIEVPLTIGVIGVVLLPVWAAIGAIAAMAAKLTLVVERTESKAE